MFGPSFVLGFVLATLFGSLFHVISGGDARRLALYFLASWMGFGLGHVTGELLAVDLFDIGALNVLNASVGAYIALMAAWLLTRTSSIERRG